MYSGLRLSSSATILSTEKLVLIRERNIAYLNQFLLYRTFNQDMGSINHGISANTRRNTPSSKPRLTHFISIPLGHILALRSSVTAFTSALLEESSRNLIEGLDQSIVIPARRLHLTLGVMALDGTKEAHKDDGMFPNPSHQTVASALALLESLRPRILALLEGQQLRVPLEQIDIMPPERGHPECAHVMFASPRYDSEDGKRLKRVCEFINKEFIHAGLVINDNRPLKLHCTLLNTTYRKPKQRAGQRLPFSFPAILSSKAFLQLSSHQSISDNDSTNTAQGCADLSDRLKAQEVRDELDQANRLVPERDVANKNRNKAEYKETHSLLLGTYAVSEVQICRMGSWGPEGEYVSVGSIQLTI